MYLYLGYLFIQLYGIINVFNRNSIATSAIIFSILVFIIWSFLPMIGYIIAKLTGANGKVSKYVLFIYGFVVGLLENSLFYFDLLTKEQNLIGTFMVIFLFFVIAYIRLPQRKN